MRKSRFGSAAVVADGTVTLLHWVVSSGIPLHRVSSVNL